MQYDSPDAHEQRLTIRFRTPDGKEYAVPPTSIASDDVHRAELEDYAQRFGSAGLELLRALEAPLHDMPVTTEEIYTLFGLRSYNA